MDDHTSADNPAPPDDTDSPDGTAAPFDSDAPATDIPLVEEASLEYLGRWNRLISTTNWDKGRIVCEWRQALIEAAAPATDYSDEAWSQRVGNVSPQHVGRLRRTYERFGPVYRQYAGLYWSHFQSALDWPDAEMYLEGAVQNDWSVAGMRHQRWEAIGAPPDMKPRQEDVIAAELNEDVEPEEIGSVESESVADGIFDAPDSVGDTEAAVQGDVDSTPNDPQDEGHEEPVVDPVRPFENLPSLPTDVGEAFELLKLAILHHRLSGWQEISCADMLSVLDALKHLTMAPSE